MSDPMQEIRASFFVECEELLEALQDGLNRLEADGMDIETVNVVFRAVHSIKGGAGAFALDDLVGYTHVFETLLDELRAGRVGLDGELIALLFRGADMLSDLVRSARDDTPVDEAAVADLVTALEAQSGAPGAQEEEEVSFTPMALSLDLDLDLDLGPLEPLGGDPADPGLTRYEIEFVPERELFATGSEPVFLLRALSELGDTSISCEMDGLPPLADYDPAIPLMRWKIVLESSASRESITEIFDFVEGLCRLAITTETAAPQPAAVETLEREEDPVPEAPAAEDVVAVPEAPPPSPPPAATPSAETREAAPASKASAQAQPAATVRVDLDRIERMVNLVGELVINQAMLSQSFAEAGLASNSKIAAGLDEFLQLTRDIQDSVMMIRAQPVKSLFQRMGRICRESSAAVGKQVRLVTEGETTEIDKTMIERLSDPLTHMIRNAVDHGLEGTDTRVAAGKSPVGTVTLTAGHRSGRVVIEVADDGGGINRPKVQSIAEERGLIAPGLNLSDAEIDNLLFLPGFSTAGTVSNLSGRGVGMDVVKSAISALGGRISITSAPGKGTTFSISLPLTLAVLDGMVIKTGGETLVVPLSAIVETLTIRPEDLTSIGPDRLVMRVRESFVPLIDLAERLGYRPAGPLGENAIALLIASDDGGRSALVVDAIVDQRQVVIKGLEDSYGRVPGVAAATILGDGHIALILDPSDLMENIAGRGSVPQALAKAG